MYFLNCQTNIRGQTSPEVPEVPVVPGTGEWAIGPSYRVCIRSLYTTNTTRMYIFCPSENN